MNRIVLAMLVATMAATASQSHAQTFFQDRERGWFWYEPEPEPPVEPEPVPLEPPPAVVAVPAPVTPASEPVRRFSTKWFQDHYLELLEDAIDDPSEENVANYRYATRVMLDKASNFAHAFKRHALLDTLIDEGTRYPFSAAHRGGFQRIQQETRQELLKNLSEQAGLWVFMDSTCQFCEMQYPVTARFSERHGLLTSYISVDGKRLASMPDDVPMVMDQGQSDSLQIRVFPATALVIPPEKIIVISQGLLSEDLIEERIIAAAASAGLVPDEIRHAIFPMERGLLTPEDIRALGEMDSDSFVDPIRNILVDRY